MAPNIGMSSAAIFLLVVFGISGYVKAVLEPSPLPGLDVECGHLHLIEGVATTVQEACGDQFSVIYNGIDTSQTYTVEIVVGGVVRATKDFTPSDSLGDITSHVGPLSVTIGDAAAPLCNNERMKAELVLLAGTKVVRSGNQTAVIMCDFRGVDLHLQQNNAQVPGEVMVDEGQTIASALAGASPQFSVVRTDGEESLPSLAGDTCYFVAAYLTKNAPDVECLEDDHMTQPEIRYDDYVLGVPICFKTFADLSGINNKLQNILQTDLSNSGLCGDFRLVILVDPMHTIFAENSRCNNFFSITVKFTCTPKGPMCEVIRNPWSPEEPASFVYHGMDHRAEFFKYSPWMGFSDRVEDSERMQRTTETGYGRLKLLKAYVGNQIEVGSLSCPSDAKAAVTEMEAADDIPEDGSDQSFMAYLDPAFAHLDSLSPGNAGGYEAIKSSIQSDMNALTPPGDASTLADKVAFRVKIGALNSTMEIANKYSRGEELTPEDLHSILCFIAHWVKTLEMERHSLRDKTDSMEIKYAHHNLLDMVGNVTKAYIAVKTSAPEFVCFKKVFLGVAKFVSNIDMSTADSTFLFDKDQEMDGSKDEINYRKYMCNKLSRCLKKMEAMCKMTTSASRSGCQPVTNDGSDVCLMKTLQDFAMAHYKTLGLFDLRKVFMEENDEPGKECPDMEPMKPKKGPLVLWKHDETTGRLKKGIPSLAGDEICWKDVATCTCQHCDAVSSSTSTTTQQMPVK